MLIEVEAQRHRDVRGAEFLCPGAYCFAALRCEKLVSTSTPDITLSPLGTLCYRIGKLLAVKMSREPLAERAQTLLKTTAVPRGVLMVVPRRHDYWPLPSSQQS